VVLLLWCADVYQADRVSKSFMIFKVHFTGIVMEVNEPVGFGSRHDFVCKF